MSIYNEISTNQRKTWLIIGLFILFITGLFFLIGKYVDSPQTFFIWGIIFSTLSAIGSYYYSDKIVLLSVGAREAAKKEYFDYYTVTENLSIAAGLPMPRLYVMDDPAPNAFATGRDSKHALICVTTGLLEKMERIELEGVIGHELSHIKNYDILLSTIVSVLVGMIAIVTDWVLRNMWWGGLKRDNDERERQSPLLLIFFVVVLILTPLVATIIQLAISRKREYLADASGVLLTRYPEGLIKALEKIKNYQKPMRSASSATAHLFISNPFGSGKKFHNWLMSLFSTHPAIEERINILKNM